jgi:hypothetical protein
MRLIVKPPLARVAIVVLLTSAGLVGLVAAQTGSAPEPAPADVAAVGVLHQALAQRDAVILDLTQRVEKLERLVSSMAPAEPPGAAAGPSGEAPPPDDQAVGQSTAALPGARRAAQTTAAALDAPVPAAKPPLGQVASVEPAAAAPGEFEVDEEAADRALERTLVETGALLLPFGKAEVRPSFSYTRDETDSLVVLVTEDGPFTGQSEARRNEFDFGLDLRIGLPLDAQFELSLPFRIVDQSLSRFPDRPEQEDTGSGLGDLSLGIAKTLLREGRWWPDLIARVTWNTATGERRDNGVGLNGDFDEIRGSLTALKRQDPLAFVGAVSYETAFEQDDIDPGDELGFSIGTVLAASPETSLRLALSQSFVEEAEIDGGRIRGSDQVMASLTLGAAAVLGRRLLVDVSADVGLTDDAPDYAISIGLPIRFDLPIPPFLR